MVVAICLCGVIMATRVEYRCNNCNATFGSRQALGGHLKHYVACNTAASSNMPVITVPVITMPVITAAATMTSAIQSSYEECTLQQLLTRETKSDAKHRITTPVLKPHSCAGNRGSRIPHKLYEVRNNYNRKLLRANIYSHTHDIYLFSHICVA